MKINGITINDKVAIYGAGEYARQLYTYLVTFGLSDIVDCFVVTKKDDGLNEQYGKPVFSFVEWDKESFEGDIIIAIAPRNASDISDVVEGEFSGSVIQLTSDDLQWMHGEIINHRDDFAIKRDKIIAFNHWGLGYFCNCKYIFEALHKVRSDMEYVWVYCGEGVADFPAWVRTIDPVSPEFYLEYYTAGIIVTNIEFRMLGCKRSGQYLISTWHGIGPWKKMQYGMTEHLNPKMRQLYEETWEACDLMTAASDFCDYVYRGSFLYKGVIEHWGYPRNDAFFMANHFREKVFDYYGIDSSKKVVLYAPSYRNYVVENFEENKIADLYDIDLAKTAEKLSERFGSDFIVMYRVHHHYYHVFDISNVVKDAIDATFYPDIQELLVAADVLITDYSSCMWDFSLSRKPVFLYYHDADEYDEKYQGFYLHPDRYPYPKGHTNDELFEAIENFNEKEYQKQICEWFDTYGTYDDGHASERVANRILDVIDHPEKYGKA